MNDIEKQVIQFKDEHLLQVCLRINFLLSVYSAWIGEMCTEAMDEDLNFTMDVSVGTYTGQLGSHSPP
jgi:hypothetical protein